MPSTDVYLLGNAPHTAPDIVVRTSAAVVEPPAEQRGGGRPPVPITQTRRTLELETGSTHLVRSGTGGLVWLPAPTGTRWTLTVGNSLTPVVAAIRNMWATTSHRICRDVATGTLHAAHTRPVTDTDMTTMRRCLLLLLAAWNED
jgi:hypothetical protein